MASSVVIQIRRSYNFLTVLLKRYAKLFDNEPAGVSDSEITYERIALLQSTLRNHESVLKEFSTTLDTLNKDIEKFGNLFKDSDKEQRDEMKSLYEELEENPNNRQAHNIADEQRLLLLERINHIKTAIAYVELSLPEKKNKNVTENTGTETIQLCSNLLQFLQTNNPTQRPVTQIPTFDGTRGIELNENNYFRLRKADEDTHMTYATDKLQLLRKMKNLSPASDAKSCKQLFDLIQSYDRQITAAGSHICPEFFFTNCADKFPHYILSELYRQPDPLDQSMDDIYQHLSSRIYEFYLMDSRKRNSEHDSHNSPNHGKHVDKTFDKSTKKIWTCVFCGKKGHPSYYCRTYDTPQKKREILKNKEVCWLCFSPSHLSRDCSRPKCPKCKNEHNSCLCLNSELETKSPEKTIPSPSMIITESSGQETMEDTHDIEMNQILLKTAMTHIFSYTQNKYITVKVVISSGSMSSFIRSDIAEDLQLPVNKVQNRTFFGIGGLSQTHECKEVKTIFYTSNGSIIITNMLTKPFIATSLRAPLLDNNDRSFIKRNNITLANKMIDGQAFQPDILIGLDRYKLFVHMNSELELPSTLRMQNTSFGYTLYGEIPYHERNHSVTLITIDEIQQNNADAPSSQE